MDALLAQVIKERETLLISVGSAAGRKDSAAVLSLGSRLREADALQAAYERWEAQARAFLGAITYSVAAKSSTSSGASRESSAVASGRGHGVLIRQELLDKVSAMGIKLRGLHGSIYQTESGRRVGIAVATERNRNRWFLGLTDGGFDTAALLCQSQSGNTKAICLPGRFFERYGSQLSRGGNQVKFNVVRKEGKLFLTIPGHPPFEADDLVDEFEELLE